MALPLATRLREQLREFVQAVRRQYLNVIWKMDIGEGTAISLSAKLDKTNPQGIHIGRYSVVAFGAAVLTHDYVNCLNRDVHIGNNCFIGAHAIILPGVTVGDGCIVSAASVVARDIPPHCMFAGNPARIVEREVKTTHYGVRSSAAS
jgi:acetyltransferase-like isoleucine patch superfamily enzyme